jgi:hypothetical protein
MDCKRIFAKWKVFSFFCKTTVARPFWVVHAADPAVGRGQRLCLGVQLINGKLKFFFVKAMCG